MKLWQRWNKKWTSKWLNYFSTKTWNIVAYLQVHCRETAKEGFLFKCKETFLKVCVCTLFLCALYLLVFYAWNLYYYLLPLLQLFLTLFLLYCLFNVPMIYRGFFSLNAKPWNPWKEDFKGITCCLWSIHRQRMDQKLFF